MYDGPCLGQGQNQVAFWNANVYFNIWRMIFDFGKLLGGFFLVLIMVILLGLNYTAKQLSRHFFILFQG